MLLQGKKIFLRPTLPSDADILYKWENDKSNWEVSETKKPFTKKEIKNFIATQKDIYLDKQLRLMIFISTDKEKKGRNGEAENRSVGCIDLFDFNEKKAGVGILIEKKHRKKGYASEALQVLIEYSFKILKLKRLYCNIQKENEASLQLFKKYDFKITGKKMMGDKLFLRLLAE